MTKSWKSWSRKWDLDVKIAIEMITLRMTRHWRRNMYRGNTKLIIKGEENEAMTLGLKFKGLK